MTANKNNRPTVASGPSNSKKKMNTQREPVMFGCQGGLRRQEHQFQILGKAIFGHLISNPTPERMRIESRIITDERFKLNELVLQSGACSSRTHRIEMKSLFKQLSHPAVTLHSNQSPAGLSVSAQVAQRMNI